MSIFLPHPLVEANKELFSSGFSAWIASDFDIWEAFQAEANAVWRRGRRHYSARTIIEVIRHQTALCEDSGEWKINNNIAPDLARLYQLAYPSRATLFKTRIMRGSKRVA